MTEKQTPGPIIDRLINLIDTCEMALFAPDAAPGGMPQTYEEAIQLVSDLEEQIK